MRVILPAQAVKLRMIKIKITIEMAEAAWLPWALILGGAVAAIVIATVVTDNKTELGGSSLVVSPTR